MTIITIAIARNLFNDVNISDQVTSVSTEPQKPIETTEEGCDSFEGLVFKPYDPVMSAIPLNTLTDEQIEFITSKFSIINTRHEESTHLTIRTYTEDSSYVYFNEECWDCFACSFNDVFVMA